MIAYPKTNIIQGSELIGHWKGYQKKHWKGYQIPIIHVPNINAFNQLVGYVKFINAKNGTVLCRGECDLHENVLASILRERESRTSNEAALNYALQNTLSDPGCKKFLGLDSGHIKGWSLYERLVLEAVLQHYGAKTFCVDFVDNHWTALWFGLYRWNPNEHCYEARDKAETPNLLEEAKYIDYRIKQKKLPPRPVEANIELAPSYIARIIKNHSDSTMPLKEILVRCKKSIYYKKLLAWEKECEKIKIENKQAELKRNRAHLYLSLYVAETNGPAVQGLYLGEETYTIDLRKALPSYFLRPCAQNGWIVKGKDEDFDFNSRIACVVRMDVRDAQCAVGKGTFMSIKNFFPPKKTDQGYERLLEWQKGGGEIGSFLPKDFLPEIK